MLKLVKIVDTMTSTMQVWQLSKNALK